MDPLTTAYNTILLIKDAVMAVRAKEKACARLCERAERATMSMRTLADRTGGCLEPGAAAQAEAFCQLLAKILKYMNKLSSKSFLHRFVTLHVLDMELDDLQEQLEYISNDLHFAIGLDTRGLHEQDVADRKADAQALEAQLAALAADQQRMLVALGVQNKDYLEALEAMKKAMVGLEDTSVEARFAKAAYGALVRASGGMVPEVKEWTITSYEVEVGEPFARGGFGEVCLGTWRGLTTVAVKRLPSGFESNKQKKAFIAEVEVWYKLRHPNIMLLLGACPSAPQPFMIMPFMENGTLLSYSEKHPEQTLKLLHESAQGLHYLHTSNIVHGDLKAVNILVDAAGIPKLADFGFSILKQNGKSTLKARTIQGLSGGTVRWNAPEILEGGRVNFQSDVYAFGMVMWEVFSGGEIPFPNITNDLIVMSKVVAGLRPDRPLTCDDLIWDLITQCWTNERAHRPAMHSVASTLARIMGRSSRRESFGASMGGSARTSVMGLPEFGFPAVTPRPQIAQAPSFRLQGITEVGHSAVPSEFAAEPESYDHSLAASHVRGMHRSTSFREDMGAMPIQRMEATPKSASFQSLQDAVHQEHEEFPSPHRPGSAFGPAAVAGVGLSPNARFEQPSGVTPAMAYGNVGQLGYQAPIPISGHTPERSRSPSFNNVDAARLVEKAAHFVYHNADPTPVRPTAPGWEHEQGYQQPPPPAYRSGPSAHPQYGIPQSASFSNHTYLPSNPPSAPPQSDHAANTGSIERPEQRRPHPPSVPTFQYDYSESGEVLPALAPAGNIEADRVVAVPQKDAKNVSASRLPVPVNKANAKGGDGLSVSRDVLDSSNLDESELQEAGFAQGRQKPNGASEPDLKGKEKKKEKKKMTLKRKCCIGFSIFAVLAVAVFAVGVAGFATGKGFFFSKTAAKLFQEATGSGVDASGTSSSSSSTTSAAPAAATAADYTTTSVCAGMVPKSVYDGTNVQQFPLAFPNTALGNTGYRKVWALSSPCGALVTVTDTSDTSANYWTTVSVYRFPPAPASLTSPTAQATARLSKLLYMVDLDSTATLLSWSDLNSVFQINLSTNVQKTYALNVPIKRILQTLDDSRFFALLNNGTIVEWKYGAAAPTRLHGPATVTRSDSLNPFITALSYNGEWLAFSPTSTTIAIVDVATGTGYAQLNLTGIPLAFTRDKTTLFWQSSPTTFQRYDLTSRTSVKTYAPPNADWTDLTSQSIAITSDSKYIFTIVGNHPSGTSSYTYMVVQWNANTGVYKVVDGTKVSSSTVATGMRVEVTSDDRYLVWAVAGTVGVGSYDRAL
ncbi:uncharacterized protein EV422DRAFT_346859 [Fimicolochytrium jonesii]|uniref:uncharacterized protein n=1 Tax=Fimicolochytrium jonesii TaxID=1396493 RepID=UPI0022FDCA82|nr:uncharacterized protein EV422DRAFT_346859 [Fimicolochytrium jonesii]KAI8815735.1 hypothetical protein EV422DRAFT_346859 [Fimicolochytrium jonesii]